MIKKYLILSAIIFILFLTILLVKKYRMYRENFLNNSFTNLGLTYNIVYPKCPQGYKPSNNETKSCVQFCRGCKTGLCENGVCTEI